MVIILGAGIMFTIILLHKQRDLEAAGFIKSIGCKVKGSSLSNNYWVAGAALFAANAALFAIAFVTLFFMPFGTTLGLVMCIPLSLFTWLIFSEIWEGSFKDKVRMAFIGNTFFLLFMGWTIRHYMFMAWIGLVLIKCFYRWRHAGEYVCNVKKKRQLRLIELVGNDECSCQQPEQSEK
jgi:hypothetical protein